MLKSIFEAPVVTTTLSRAGNVYPRVWEAYDAMCWILVRREMPDSENPTLRDVYRLHKQQPGKFGVPGLTVIYTVDLEAIHFHTLRVN